MNIEKNIFKRAIIDKNKLKEYGFNNNKYETTFLNEFKAIISIDNKGNVHGKVIDLETNEEYTNIYTEMNGEFVSKVRNEYKRILIDIRDKCFINKYFIYDQANRISKFIKEEYNVIPEFLWDDSPGCGVFRNNKTN